MSDNYGILTKQKNDEKSGVFSTFEALALIGLLSEIAETPVFIGISSAENKSHNGVRTESERSQNGVRKEAEPAKGGPESACRCQRVPIGVLLDFDDVKLRRNRAPCKSSFPFASACVILHFPCFFSACCSGRCPCAAPLSYVPEIGRVKPGRRGSSTIR